MPLFGDPKGAADIPRHLRRRRGGERQHGPQPQFFHHARQPQIFRAKIVSPLRDAVRLIDGHERDLHAPQPIQKRLTREPLRSHIEQLQLSGPQIRIHPLRLFRGQARIQPRRRHAARPQRIDLIFHQRDERRNHQRRSLEEHRRQLITKRLSRPRGKKRQRRLSCEQRAHHRFLPLAKRLVAKVRAKFADKSMPESVRAMLLSRSTSCISARCRKGSVRSGQL